MVSSLKRSLLVCAGTAWAASLAGGERLAPQSLPDGSPAPGPVVLVTPRYGRDPYACYLTRIHAGVITVRMLGGEERQEVITEVASVRFNPEHIPPPPPHERGPRELREPREPQDGFLPLPDGPPPPRDGREPPPRDGPPNNWERRPLNGKPRPLDGVLLRLKELQDREQNDKLTDKEADELRKLREEGELFPPGSSRWWRIATARSAARQASKSGKLDEHIAAMRERLVAAGTLGEAHDALIMLGHAYISRDGPVFPDIIRKVEKDIVSIRSEKIRRELTDNPPEFVEVLREQKPPPPPVKP